MDNTPSSTCVICDSPVKGRIFGIRPKFCCVECCSNFVGTKSKHYNRRLVSVSRALYHYNCTARDLEVLNFKTEKNPIDENGRPMRLFLGAEVDYLMDLKVEAIRREAMVESVVEYVTEKLAIEEKMERLERKLGIRLGELEAIERAFLLDDFLTKGNGTVATLLSVQQRFNQLDRFRKILDCTPNAHPGAVFDFCVAYPEAGPAEFMDLQRRCQMVFYAVGELIVDKLTDDEKSILEGLEIKKMMPTHLSPPQATIYWYLNHSGFADDCLLISASEAPDTASSMLRVIRGRKTETGSASY